MSPQEAYELFLRQGYYADDAHRNLGLQYMNQSQTASDGGMNFLGMESVNNEYSPNIWAWDPSTTTNSQRIQTDYNNYYAANPTKPQSVIGGTQTGSLSQPQAPSANYMPTLMQQYASGQNPNFNLMEEMRKMFSKWQGMPNFKTLPGGGSSTSSVNWGMPLKQQGMNTMFNYPSIQDMWTL